MKKNILPVCLGNIYYYVITVCDAEAAECCPIFPHNLKKILWPFPDPSSFRGSEENLMEKTREAPKKTSALSFIF